MASERPSFSAPLWAAARQGAKELSQVLPAFPESVRIVEEAGAMGNPTPQQVTAQIDPGYEAMVDRYAGQVKEQEQELERD
jgi:hypothetical protein